MSDLVSLAQPLSKKDPCGPDLEEEGDGNYEDFMALAEGYMPASFFEFDQTSLNLAAELDKISNLLEKTRDLRLFSFATRYTILAGDIIQFADSLEAMSILLAEQWETVHPQGEDGDFQYRLSQVQALDDMVTVVLPLQFSTLLNSRRHGKISFRQKLVAEGTSQARAGEETLDMSTILDAFEKENDIDDLLSVYDAIERCATALKSITRSFSDNTEHEFTPNFDRLEETVRNIFNFLSEVLASRDPSLVKGEIEETSVETDGEEKPEESGEAAPQIDAGPLEDQPPLVSMGDARSALQAVEGYFSQNEPSNPSVLLVRQAQQLIGKSFIEAMEVILPGQVGKAIVHLAGGQSLQIPMDQLKSFSSSSTPSPEGGTKSNTYVVPTRSDALHLIGAIEVFFRRTEPSSPIPLLLAQAKNYSNKDFAALIKDLIKEPVEAAAKAPAKKKDN